MAELDVSTRSTDHMLGGSDEEERTGISLSSLTHSLTRKSKATSSGTHSATPSHTHSRSSFDHLIPKKHHNKLNKLHKSGSQSLPHSHTHSDTSSHTPSHTHSHTHSQLSEHGDDDHEEQEIIAAQRDTTIGEIRCSHSLCHSLTHSFITRCHIGSSTLHLTHSLTHHSLPY